MPLAHTPMGSPRYTRSKESWFKRKNKGRLRNWIRGKFTQTYENNTSHVQPSAELRPWQVVEAEKAAKAGRTSPYIYLEHPNLGIGSTLAASRLVVWLQKKELSGNGDHGHGGHERYGEHEEHGHSGGHAAEGHGAGERISSQKAKIILDAKLKWGEVETATKELNHQIATLSSGEIQEFHLKRGFTRTAHAGGSRRGLAAKIFGEKTSYRKVKSPRTKITIPSIPIIKHIPFASFLSENLIIPALSGIANALTFPIRRRRTVGHVIAQNLNPLVERLQTAQAEFEQLRSQIREVDVLDYNHEMEKFYREMERKGNAVTTH